MRRTRNDETRRGGPGVARALGRLPEGLAVLVSGAAALLKRSGETASPHDAAAAEWSRRSGKGASGGAGAGAESAVEPETLSILHVSQPTDGGVARHVADLALETRRRGIRVGVACPEWGWLAGDVRGGGVGFEPVVLVRKPDPREDFAAFVALVRIIRRGRYDLVHAHSAKAGVLGRAAALVAGVPAVYTPHAWSFLAAGSRAERFVYRAVERVLAHVATRKVLCVSTAEMELGSRVVGVPRDKLKVVPNGVRVPSWVVRAVETRRGGATAPEPERAGRRRTTRCERAARGDGGARGGAT